MDNTIIMKDLLISLARGLVQSLNGTDEQILLAMLGAYTQLKEEAEAQGKELQRLMQSMEVTRNIRKAE